jgi:hypothetical protein
VTFKEFAAKKVAGVPVLYLGAAGAIILAIVAWRMKPTPDEDTAGVDPEDGAAGADEESNAGGLIGMGTPYDGFTTNGTVVVQPTVPEADEVDTIDDNDEWARAGAEWLVAKNKATGTQAATALNKYIGGEELSYEQNALVDEVIKEKGQPPDPIGAIGTISPSPAQKQFQAFPGHHVVKNNNDNTPAKLATLYYGNGDALHANKIAAANNKLGPSGTTYSAGTRVFIPAWVSPGYFIATASARSAQDIAKKSGISVAVLQGLNPGMVFPVAIGTKVRNH